MVKSRALLATTFLAFVSIVLLFTFYETDPIGRFVSVVVTTVYILALHYIALWSLISRRFGVRNAQVAIVTSPF